MTGRHIGADLGLFREGFQIGREYGLHSLEMLARIAYLLEMSVYEKGSMRAIPGGVAFSLRNPPLRVGAFSGLSLQWDGVAVPRPACTIRPEGVPSPIGFDRVSREAPVVLDHGRGIEFTAAIGDPSPGLHTIRLELRNLAIPPTVWFQTTDRVRPASASPP